MIYEHNMNIIYIHNFALLSMMLEILIRRKGNILNIKNHTYIDLTLVLYPTDYFTKYKPVCPSCGEIYGKIHGDQPADGQMTSEVRHDIHLPGHEDMGTIVITYSFPDGTQGVSTSHICLFVCLFVGVKCDFSMKF